MVCILHLFLSWSVLLSAFLAMVSIIIVCIISVFIIIVCIIIAFVFRQVTIHYLILALFSLLFCYSCFKAGAKNNCWYYLSYYISIVSHIFYICLVFLSGRRVVALCRCLLVLLPCCCLLLLLLRSSPCPSPFGVWVPGGRLRCFCFCFCFCFAVACLPCLLLLLLALLACLACLPCLLVPLLCSLFVCCCLSCPSVSSSLVRSSSSGSIIYHWLG